MRQALPRTKNRRLAAGYHAVKRAKERFGFSKSDVKQIERTIEKAGRYNDRLRAGQINEMRDERPLAWIMHKYTQGREKWRVKFDGRDVIVIYDTIRETVVTVFPDDRAPQVRE